MLRPCEIRYHIFLVFTTVPKPTPEEYLSIPCSQQGLLLQQELGMPTLAAQELNTLSSHGQHAFDTSERLPKVSRGSYISICQASPILQGSSVPIM